ncbi:hypothetical protein N5I84_09215 [Ralstonia sp. CHL-2022]|uniref:hypothetical protein n=1 Tax=Ralstonia mojiangensis TaxID=2953895 RepID=UPI0021B3401A|nr:hypothetical protein [Ralstonia mojiangensis]MCT7296341.1 hypothetical protein [Ralstonia mojiangensis]
MFGQSGSVVSVLGGFLSWIVREHCMRNPELVAKAWEQMDAEAPTLADAGRMFSAYGVDFNTAELRYIANHPDALMLARSAAAGWPYIEFKEAKGFIADDSFVPPAPKAVGRAGIAIFGSTVGVLITLLVALGGNLKLLAVLGAVTALSWLLALLEFSEVRNRHRARKAIELCAKKGSNIAST